MKSKLLTERLQELAGIRPLYELEKELLETIEQLKGKVVEGEHKVIEDDD